MKPVVFDDCFGWLHPAAGPDGVVLCNPFGYDALCTHRGWRQLAERIAASGRPVLRFDYPGAGDSAGAEEDAGRVEAWIDSIGAAVRRLREWTGVTRVTIVGLRLGATLAALAAERCGDIDGLVLLAPVVVGRNYLRELRAHRQSWLSTPAGLSAKPIAETDAYIEAFGFGLHGDDIAQLGRVDLRQDTRRPARRVLLLDSVDRVRGAALVSHYTAQGVAVESGGFDESDRFLIEALYSEPPLDAFARVLAWLGRGGESAGAQRAAPLQTSPPDTLQASHALHTLRLADIAATEHPVVFGPYFGVHCQPDRPRHGAPAVLFVNTGASHHIGDGRIFVLFARRLARAGIASLRMDLGGLGDATPAAAAITLDTIYADDSSRDAAAGADWLVARGYARLVVFGVCGGAFVGLHTGMRHPHVTGIYGVNLQKFIWDGGARAPGAHQFASSKVYLRSAMTRAKWRRALRGESHPLRIAGVLGRRIARRLALGGADWIERRTGWPVISNPVRTLVRELHAKGVHTRLVFGEYDVGLDEARVQFGGRLAALRRYRNVRVTTLQDLDHALFTQTAREAAMADAEQWIFSEFVAADEPRSASALRSGIPPQHAAPCVADMTGSARLPRRSPQ